MSEAGIGTLTKAWRQTRRSLCWPCSEDDACRFPRVVDGSLVSDSCPAARISPIDGPQRSCSHGDKNG
jgi:hypothetical protein